jgi:signal transduction histidine kinase
MPDDQVYPANRELLKLVHRSGQRLQRLVNMLLDFSRIEAGRAQADYLPTDLSAFTTDLVSSFRSAMERAGLRFSVDCVPLSQRVYIDREMWEKVVLNLVSNAFKYTLEGSVGVRLAERGGRAELSVSDTGIGIPQEELPHVFERFHRVEGTRGRTHEGTGIGLALVQELVKLHGGAVSVESTPGQGSTFTVSLPFGAGHLPPHRLGKERELQATAAHADAYVEEALRWLPETESNLSTQIPVEKDSVTFSGPRSRVILADDNADMREYVRRLLSSRYEVTAVANGAEAAAAALTHAPDLVLTDVMMPVLDGFGLLRALRSREQTKTLPIILLSARAGEESRVAGLDAGADDYLVKPFTARELLARVEAHLSLARMRRQADQARRLSEVRLGLALEATRMFAWEWDPVRDQVYGMGDMQSIFGTTLGTAAEGFRLVHPDDIHEHQTKVERVAREGGYYHSEFRIIRADTAAMAWLEERATAIMDGNGQVLRVVGVVADVTERKAAEEEMRLRNEQLTKANMELEEFAYVASHDLQEPLRTVGIYTQLLLRRLESPDAETAQYAAFVRNGVRRMDELIKDLLVYSRVVHPEQEEPKAAELERSLNEAMATLRVRIEETGATVIRDPLPEVWGDERQFTLVFQNLLSNALKYRKTDEAPRILIGAEAVNGDWVITIKDSGIGFDQQHAERIFGLFKRLHKDAYPGTGLGLAISKRIVERYGGRIWAESEGEGQGAALRFTLRPGKR